MKRSGGRSGEFSELTVETLNFIHSIIVQLVMPKALLSHSREKLFAHFLGMRRRKL